MSQNMYNLKPYYTTSEVLDTPDCMYKLNRIYQNDNTKVASSTEDVSPEVAALERRQEAILQRLGVLKLEVEALSKTQKPSSKTATTTNSSSNAGHVLPVGVLQDIVINASVTHPPLYVLVLYEMLAAQYRVLTSTYIHSSVTDVPAGLASLLPSKPLGSSRTDHQLAITLIWKQDARGTSMMLSPSLQTAVYGDANVARYLARLLNPAYDACDAVQATQIDNWLDQATQVIRGSNKERAAVLRALNASLGKSSWVVGDDMTLADVLLWSALQQNKMTQAVPGNVKKWLEACNQKEIFQNCLKVAGQL